MLKLCDAKYCYYNTPRVLNEIEKAKIIQIKCPSCKTAVYCSQQCQIIDRFYTFFFQNQFEKSKDNHRVCASAHQIEQDESAASMKSMKRKPEDFQFTYKNGSCELGKGSFGEVKLVTENSTGILYAMKILSKKIIVEYCTVSNIKQEIKLQRKLFHPNIIRLLYYFEDKFNVYLILEYAENGSLFKYLKKCKRFPENEAFVYFFQTCLGIDYLHKNKIIHRDLKPENLLLDKEGNVKVGDFGWSTQTKTSKELRTTFCGTCEYMAPEMIRGQPYDFSLDYWCLGILLYELLHGITPFRGKNDHEICEAILRRKQIVFAPYISQEAQQLITQLLEYEPQKRLNMRQIFEHPWMHKNAQIYQIDIFYYVFQPVSDMNQFEMQKNWNKNDLSAYLSGPNRVSRQSKRNELIQQEVQKKRNEIGFIDRIYFAFGCLKREKNK